MRRVVVIYEWTTGRTLAAMLGIGAAAFFVARWIDVVNG